MTRLFPRLVRPLLWLLLALPAMWMLAGLLQGDLLLMDLIEPTGDWAIRLMILALLPGPLIDGLGPSRLLRAWLAARRNIGVAAFLYALFHLGAYALDMGSLAAILEEAGLAGIWTGWLALALMVPAAATSADRAMRGLGRRWKTVQRAVYPALLVTFAHWLLLEWSWQKAAIHAAPLIIAWALRLRRRIKTPRRKKT